MPMQIRRTATPNLPPTGLAPGQLAVEMADPMRLWVGVPTTVDPSGRRLIAPGNTETGPTNPTSPNVGDVFYNSTTNQLLYYDGTNWVQILPDAPNDGNAYARQSGQWEQIIIPAQSPGYRMLLQTQSVAATPVSSVDVLYNFDNTFLQYELDIIDFRVSTDARLLAQVTVDGSTFISATMYYQAQLWVDSLGGGPTGATQNISSMMFAQAMTSQTMFGAEFRLYFPIPYVTGQSKSMLYTAMYLTTAGGPSCAFGTNHLTNLNAWRGFRFYLTAGQITRGTFNLYGIVPA